MERRPERSYSWSMIRLLTLRRRAGSAAPARLGPLAPFVALPGLAGGVPALAFVILALTPGAGLAQADATSAAGEPSPVTVADEFNRGFQSMAWEGLVQRIHPRGLADLRLASDILVAADSSGYVLESLLGDLDPESYATLADDEAVVLMLTGIQAEVPGLLSSLVSRRTETLGAVSEGELRHVVYRIQALVSGSVPETRVMTLERFQGRWTVVDAADLRVLHTAIRGIPIPR